MYTKNKSLYVWNHRVLSNTHAKSKLGHDKENLPLYMKEQIKVCERVITKPYLNYLVEILGTK